LKNELNRESTIEKNHTYAFFFINKTDWIFEFFQVTESIATGKICNQNRPVLLLKFLKSTKFSKTNFQSLAQKCHVLKLQFISVAEL
jgi:hypothetical protein